MAEKDYLRMISNSIEKFVPTNRSLLNFINSKARGTGIDLSFFKVQFLNKSEKSTYTCMSVELNEVRRQLKEFGLSDTEYERLTQEAEECMKEARGRVERVYDEVRRYIVTSELRTMCMSTYFKKIPTLSAKQNEAVGKEIFTLAYEENRQGEDHDIKEIVGLFHRINKIALSVFDAAASAK